MNRPHLTSASLAAALVLAAPSMDRLSAADIAVEFTPIYPNLTYERPVHIAIPPDGSGDRFLVQQKGIIYQLPESLDSADEEAEVFLDISDRTLIDNPFEEGLLNLTFHPDFATNRKFYLYYTIQNPKRGRLSEMQVRADDPRTPDPTTERILLEVPQPFWNHNSGSAAFGPDGFLYLCLGDGGKANDPHLLGQNLWALHGKVLRLDVNSTQGDLPYAIPPDNPFAQQEGVRPEIYAYGLRNPWGIHFDADGRFWLADVGQGLWEEINLITAGGNYGWNFREGAHPFELRTAEPPEDATFIDPIHEYPHADGISVTGGFVYTGSAVPELAGYYLYSDFHFGTVWALNYDGTRVVENIVLRPGTPGQLFKPTSLQPDTDGEVLLTSWDGILYRMQKK
ncbi:PQQ-dependent sugar dehydrogenase [soil metagenome]